MSKKRYINDNIREDNYVMDLDPSEKLLFIYLLTNNRVSLCWIYELHTRKIEMETWFDRDLIKRILLRFEKADKVYYREWYVFISNFVKNQSMNDNMKKWLKRELEELWQERVGMFCNLKGFERLSKALESFGILNFTLPYLTSLNLTLPIGSDLESSDKKIEIEEEKPKPPKKKYTDTFETFRQLYPVKKWKWDAYKSWNKKKNKPDIQTITQKVKDMIAEKEYKDRIKEFCPDYKHPSTWINQECWDDEYETWKKLVKRKKIVRPEDIDLWF